MGCHFLLQGIFPTQELNPHLLHWQADILPLSHQESPAGEYKVASCATQPSVKNVCPRGWGPRGFRITMTMGPSECLRGGCGGAGEPHLPQHTHTAYGLFFGERRGCTQESLEIKRVRLEEGTAVYSHDPPCDCSGWGTAERSCN